MRGELGRQVAEGRRRRRRFGILRDRPFGVERGPVERRLEHRVRVVLRGRGTHVAGDGRSLRRARESFLQQSARPPRGGRRRRGLAPDPGVREQERARHALEELWVVHVCVVRPPAQPRTPHLRDGFRVGASRPPREKHRRPVDDESLPRLGASPRGDGGERPRVRLERLLAVRLSRVERLVPHELALVVDPEQPAPRGRFRDPVAKNDLRADPRLMTRCPERHQTRLGHIQRVAVKLRLPTLEAAPLVRIRRAGAVRPGRRIRRAPDRASSETQKTRRPRQRRGQEPAKAGHGGGDDEGGTVQHRRRQRLQG